MEEGWMNGGLSFDSTYNFDDGSVPKIEGVQCSSAIAIDEGDSILGIDSVYNSDCSRSQGITDDIDIDISSTFQFSNSWTNSAITNNTQHNSILHTPTPSQNGTSSAIGVFEKGAGGNGSAADGSETDEEAEEVMWKCARCDAEFPSRDDVKQHVQAVHKKEPSKQEQSQKQKDQQQPPALTETVVGLPVIENYSDLPIIETLIDSPISITMDEAHDSPIIDDNGGHDLQITSVRSVENADPFSQLQPHAFPNFLPISVLTPFSNAFSMPESSPSTSVLWTVPANQPNQSQVQYSVLDSVNRVYGVLPAGRRKAQPKAKPVIKPKAAPSHRPRIIRKPKNQNEIIIPALSEMETIEQYQPFITNSLNTRVGAGANGLDYQPYFNNINNRRLITFPDNDSDFMPVPKIPAYRPTKVEKLEYKCNICDAAYPTDEALQKHMETLTFKPSIWKCHVCPDIFTSETSWKLHVHYVPKETLNQAKKCTACKRHFADEYEFAHHSTKHAKKRIWKCACCLRDFDTIHSLRLHEKAQLKKHKVGGYKCTTCPMTFPTQEEKSVHMRSHEVSMKCSQCDKVFNSYDKLQKHVYYSHTSMPWHCTTCGESFLEKVELDGHMKMKHNTNDDSTTCGKCGKKFGRAAALKQHQQICMKKSEDDNADDDIIEVTDEKTKNSKTSISSKGKKTLTCTLCKTNFTDPAIYQRHMKKHKFLADKKKKALSAISPGQKFRIKSAPNSAGSLRIAPKPSQSPFSPARTTVTPSIQYKCAICGKIFTSKDNLRHHAKVHMSDRRFKCTQLDCSEVFRTPQERNQHLLAVHGLTEQSYKCKECYKTFEKQRELDRHELTHKKSEEESVSENVEGEFKCSTCGKSFHHEDLLKMHSKEHESNQSDYKCEYCNKKFKNMASLNMHSKKSHPEAVSAAIEEIVLD